MILMLNKDYEDLGKQAEERLRSEGFTTEAGSIAKLLLNIVNSEMSEFYEALTVNHTQAFLSTAEGEFLDAIGMLLNCTRIIDEDDESFKHRISQQVMYTATSNETAIRLAVLSVMGVEDVVLMKHSFGSGSFTVLVIPEKDSDEINVIGRVTDAVEEMCGFGIKFTVETPKTKKVKLKIKLLNKDKTPDGVGQELKFATKNQLREYFTSLKIGEPIIINSITNQIMELGANVVSYTAEEFRIDGKMSMFVNQECRWNERFMLSSEPDAILVM